MFVLTGGGCCVSLVMYNVTVCNVMLWVFNKCVLQLVVPSCSSCHYVTCCLLLIPGCAGFVGSILYSRSGRLL